MNTLERKKIKGGEYEYFIADEDGNFIEKVSISKILETIKFSNESLHLFDEDHQLVLKKYIDNLLTLTTLKIEYNSIKKP